MNMQVHLAQVNANMMHFLVSYAVAFIAFDLVAKWYVWPNIRERTPKVALTPLLLYSCLRVNGLMFLMPGLVSPNLPRRSPCRRPMAISRQRSSR